MIKWCGMNGINCPSTLCSGGPCVLDYFSVGTDVYWINSEALFWVTLYRLTEESRLDELMLYIPQLHYKNGLLRFPLESADDVADHYFRELKAKTNGGKHWVTDVLKKIYSGERCYFIAYRLPTVFPTYRMKWKDYLAKFDAFKTQKQIEAYIRTQIRMYYGVMPKKKERFNPFIRAIGLWAYLNKTENITEAKSELSMISMEIDDNLFSDDPHFRKIFRGTRECIKKRRICSVPWRNQN